MQTFLRTLSVICAFGLVTALVASAEDKELRERAHQLLQKAEQLAEKGRVQEAEKLHHEAQKVLKESESSEVERPVPIERQIDRLHQELKELDETHRRLAKSGNKAELAELRERRADVERELSTLQKHHKRGDAEAREHGDDQHGEHHDQRHDLEDGGRRLKHLRVAIENLHAAGAHEIAEELTGRANAMERELHEVKEHLANESHAHEHAKPAPQEPDKKHRGDPVEDLRREVQQLRAEIKEIREILHNRR